MPVPSGTIPSQRRGDESAELKQLRAANRELQRQKAEVLAGFKAALKLVDVLKRQKVHVSGHGHRHRPCAAPAYTERPYPAFASIKSPCAD